MINKERKKVIILRAKIKGFVLTCTRLKPIETSMSLQ